MSFPDFTHAFLVRNLFPPDPPTDREMRRRAVIVALNRSADALRLLPPPPQPAPDPLYELPIDNQKGTDQ